MAARTVLITGGARGIGAAIARVLAARGCRVIAPPRAELDLSSPGSIAAYVDRQRDVPLHILVNNAGINALRLLGQIDDVTWQSMLQTNLSSR